MSKLVYAFEEGSKDLKNLLGGKGANLSEMTNIGLPVPPGFTLSTEACNEYYKKGKILWDDLKHEIEDNMKKLEAKTGKRFGSEKKSTFSFCKIRCSCIYARNDGYSLKSRPK